MPANSQQGTDGAGSQKTLATLSEEELGDLLALVEGADSVELKLTVPESDHRSTVAALGMDALDAQIRQVFFFDTPDLTLLSSGVVARARVQGRAVTRSSSCGRSSRASCQGEARPRGLGVEVDAMPGGYVALPREGKGRERRREGRGGRYACYPQTVSKEQRAFFARHAPDGSSWTCSRSSADLRPQLSFSPKGFERKLVAEMWMYPDFSRILELSTKCRTDEMFDVAATIPHTSPRNGVDLAGNQETKTRKALEFHARQLRHR